MVCDKRLGNEAIYDLRFMIYDLESGGGSASRGDLSESK